MGWPEITPENLRTMLDTLMLEANSNPLILTVYESPDSVNWTFPPIVTIPLSTMQAYELGALGKNEGLSGHCQIFDFDFPFDNLPAYGLGFRIKYSAEGDPAILTNAYIDLEYKVINHLGDKSTDVVTAADFLIPVPALSTEQTERYMDFGFIPSGSLSVGAMVIMKIFGRDATHVLDTLAPTRLLIEEIKPRLMQGVVPPISPV